MSEPQPRMIEAECPQCHSRLWVDIQTGQVVQHKKSEKKVHQSLEEMLVKEKDKKEKVDDRFLQAKSLEESKKKKAEEFFDQTLKK